jgi:hypothetical protein
VTFGEPLVVEMVQTAPDVPFQNPFGALRRRESSRVNGGELVHLILEIAG